MAETNQAEIVKGPHHYDPVERKYVADGPKPPPLTRPVPKQDEIVKGTHYYDEEKREYRAGERPTRSAHSNKPAAGTTVLADVAPEPGPSKRPRVKQSIDEEVLEEMSPAKRKKVS